MTCEATDLTKTITFMRNNTARGTCISSTICLGSGLHPQMPKTVILTIASLSYSNDIGSWTCSYDGVDAVPSPFLVYGECTIFYHLITTTELKAERVLLIISLVSKEILGIFLLPLFVCLSF